jgi:hypothetical protein
VDTTANNTIDAAVAMRIMVFMVWINGLFLDDSTWIRIHGEHPSGTSISIRPDLPRNL